MKMPKNFHPEFIGRVIKMQADYPKHSPIWRLLCDAVAWMRERNAGTAACPEYEEHHGMMIQKQLAGYGVVIG